MRPINLSIEPAAVDADGLASANSSAGASVTLDGALTSGGVFVSADGLGRQFVITDAGAHDQSSTVYTFTGRDVNNKEVSYSRLGPGSGASVETDFYLKEVDSITLTTPVAGSTVSIGTVDEVEAPTIPLNWRTDSGANISVDVTGTLNYTAQETNVKIQSETPVWFDITGLVGQTANQTSSATIATTGMRFIFNSYSSGASLQVYLTQAE